MLTFEQREKKIQGLWHKIAELQTLKAEWLPEDYRQGMIRAYSHALSLHEKELRRQRLRAPLASESIAHHPGQESSERVA